MRNVYLILILLINIAVCKSQQISPMAAENGGNSDISEIVKSFSCFNSLQPMEPTTASLGRYGEYKMDNSNGIPNISIPLYEIKDGDLSIPITLSYQGGGIRVSQEATWVGLGWDLFYGGQLTRVVQGFPDESEPSPNERPTAANIQNYIEKNNSNISDGYLYQMSSGSQTYYSYMPDSYYYNIGSENGKFIGIDVETLVPHAPVKISGGRSNSWQIKNSKGDTYFFNRKEITKTITEAKTMPEYTSAWYIDRIVSATNKIIKYEYQTDGYYVDNGTTYYEGYTEKSSNGPSSSIITRIDSRNASTQTKITSSKPRCIYFGKGRLTFVLGPRNDIKNSDQSAPIQKLDMIIIEEQTANNVYSPLKYIHFNYSYKNNRLILEDIYEKNLKNQAKLIAKFTYDKEVLPSRKSADYDFCGFYNGKKNSTNIPLHVIHTSVNNPLIIGGADKSISEKHAKAGSLLSIEYPTKGKTVFTWESNRYGVEKPLFDPYIEQHLSVNGTCPELDCTTTYPPNPYDDDPLCTHLDRRMEFSVYTDQEAYVNGSIEIVNPNTTIHYKYDKAEISVFDRTDGHYLLNEGTDKINDKTIRKYVVLQAGHSYIITANANCGNIRVSATITYNSYNPSQDKYNYTYGGLRIREIANYDTDDNLLEKTLYTYMNPNSPEKSSGYITNDAPVFSERSSSSVERGSTSTEHPGLCTNDYTYTTLYYDSPITGIYPNNHNYRYVQMQKINSTGNNIGIVKSEYRTSFDITTNRDMPISTSNERGQLLHQSIYDSENNLQEETINHYSRHSGIESFSRGFKLLKHLDVKSFCTSGEFSLNMMYVPIDHSIYSTWVKLDSVIQYSYLKQEPIRNKTEYIYADIYSCQPTSIINHLNNGEHKVNQFKYASQLTDTVSRAMVEQNIVSQYLTKEDRIGDKLISKQINKYKIQKVASSHFDYHNPTVILLDSILIQKGLSKAETELKINRYNDANNIMEYETKSKIPVSYLWGYNNQFPIAEIKNTSYNNLEQVLGQDLINRVANSATPSDGDLNEINNLRSNTEILKDAQITTYTYKPLVGITSITNPSKGTVYYDYDDFGRLKYIKDNDKNVVERYSYHYKDTIATPIPPVDPPVEDTVVEFVDIKYSLGSVTARILCKEPVTIVFDLTSIVGPSRARALARSYSTYVIGNETYSYSLIGTNIVRISQR